MNASASDPILVELVDSDGAPVGTSEKLAAHQAPGALHRAFSLFAFDAGDRLLLQQRAAIKYHSPLQWTNTACGHPFPAEAPADAVRRRAHEELGATLSDLEEVGTVEYQVNDHATELVEFEFNHVHIARVEGEIELNPDEVADVQWVTAADLAQVRGQFGLTAWFDDVLRLAAPRIRAEYPGFGDPDAVLNAPDAHTSIPRPGSVA